MPSLMRIFLFGLLLRQVLYSDLPLQAPLAGFDEKDKIDNASADSYWQSFGGQGSVAAGSLDNNESDVKFDGSWN